MIQLYVKSNSDFTKNGNYVLFPITAKTYSEINGEWSASISCPIDDDGVWKYIKPAAVIKMPSHNGDQLYRITRVEISDAGVDAEMLPIFFDSAGDCFLPDVRPTQKTGQQALDIMTAVNPKYSGVSDIETKTTAYYEYKNLMEAIAGNDDNSFLQRWGGEIEYDNFTVRIMNKLGENRGVRVIQGKNILENGIKETIDISSLITRIYPVAYNGRHMSGDGYVRTSFENEFPIPHAAVVEYPHIVLMADAGSADMTDPTILRAFNQAELDTLLNRAAWEDLVLQRLTFAKFTDEINMADIRNSQEYAEEPWKDLETIELGDTVRIEYPKLNIYINSRVMGIEYDSANDRIDKILLSDDYPTGNYFTQMNGTVAAVKGAVNTDGTMKAAQMAGAISDYVSMKCVTKSPTDGVTVMRLGDIVTLVFNAKSLTQAASMIIQSWTIPEGYRPATAQNFYIATVGGHAALNLKSDGSVYIQPPDSGTHIYSDSVTYRTGDAMPALS